MAVKGMALDALHRIFLERAQGPGSARAREYERYVAEHDPGLTSFATWMAIAEHERKWDWRTWPAQLHDPASAAVARARVHVRAPRRFSPVGAVRGRPAVG